MRHHLICTGIILAGEDILALTECLAADLREIGVGIRVIVITLEGNRRDSDSLGKCYSILYVGGKLYSILLTRLVFLARIVGHAERIVTVLEYPRAEVIAARLAGGGIKTEDYLLARHRGVAALARLGVVLGNRLQLRPVFLIVGVTVGRAALHDVLHEAVGVHLKVGIALTVSVERVCLAISGIIRVETPLLLPFVGHTVTVGVEACRT